TCIFAYGQTGSGKTYTIEYILNEIIDLAGCERINKSLVENNKLNQTKYINKSLSALANIIKQLQNKNSYINFRDNKLTHILKDIFSQKNKTYILFYLIKY
ncbi:kinesin-like protein KIN-14J, partial [Alosa alosa]|uniref:kinesin-like protein KIN-14J n=1 Tax=Alosa alosa TaxID=278164 RepID=UPI0020154A25